MPLCCYCAGRASKCYICSAMLTNKQWIREHQGQLRSGMQQATLNWHCSCLLLFYRFYIAHCYASGTQHDQVTDPWCTTVGLEMEWKHRTPVPQVEVYWIMLPSLASGPTSASDH